MLMRAAMLASFALTDPVGCATIDGDWSSQDLRYSAPREERVDIEGATRVLVLAKAGLLTVQGEPQRTSIDIAGLAKATDEALLEEIKISVSRQSDLITVEAIVPEVEGEWGGRVLDLTVQVPNFFDVEIHDSSGSLTLADVHSAKIHDGSGSMTVRHLAGDLSVDDGSGSIEIREVAGAVSLRDGSGSIKVRHVGSVHVEVDGSGSIEIEHVDHDVMVTEDGSGSILAKTIGGNVVVQRDGSGDVVVHDVGGEVHVP